MELVDLRFRYVHLHSVSTVKDIHDPRYAPKVYTIRIGFASPGKPRSMPIPIVIFADRGKAEGFELLGLDLRKYCRGS